MKIPVNDQGGGSMKFPKEILVYVCDYDDGKPIFGIARNVEDIPEDCDRGKVGNYTLNRERIFRVRRHLT